MLSISKAEPSNELNNTTSYSEPEPVCVTVKACPVPLLHISNCLLIIISLLIVLIFSITSKEPSTIKLPEILTSEFMYTTSLSASIFVIEISLTFKLLLFRKETSEFMCIVSLRASIFAIEISPTFKLPLLKETSECMFTISVSDPILVNDTFGTRNKVLIETSDSKVMPEPSLNSDILLKEPSLLFNSPSLLK